MRSFCFLYFEILFKFADILLFSFFNNGLLLSIVCVDEKITAQLYKYLSILVLLVKLCKDESLIIFRGHGLEVVRPYSPFAEDTAV